MSGGSHNYLCMVDFFSQYGVYDGFTKMIESLEQHLPESAEALAETKYIFAFLSDYGPRREALREVWRAVEWMESGDSGIEYVQESLQAYNEIVKGQNHE